MVKCIPKFSPIYLQICQTLFIFNYWIIHILNVYFWHMCTKTNQQRSLFKKPWPIPERFSTKSHSTIVERLEKRENVYWTNTRFETVNSNDITNSSMFWDKPNGRVKFQNEINRYEYMVSKGIPEDKDYSRKNVDVKFIKRESILFSHSVNWSTNNSLPERWC